MTSLRIVQYPFLNVHCSLKLKCQGDHGGCLANYRCCLPALAGFVSPHSMGPGAMNLRQRCSGFKQNCFEHRRSFARLMLEPAEFLLFCPVKQAEYAHADDNEIETKKIGDRSR